VPVGMFWEPEHAVCRNAECPVRFLPLFFSPFPLPSALPPHKIKTGFVDWKVTAKL